MFNAEETVGEVGIGIIIIIYKNYQGAPAPSVRTAIRTMYFA